MKESSHFLDVNEVMKITGKKRSKSYEIIRTLNKELEAKGKITIQGIVPRKYFFERIGG